MKATWKRVIALILVLVMVQVQGISVRAEANKSNQNTSSLITETYINPLYADEIRESDLASPDEASAIATYANEEYTDSVEEAGAKIREGMKQREESIVIYFQAPEYSKELLVEIANQALVHTGNPTEGDYLRWQYGGWTSSTSYYTKDSTDYMTITYTYTYYTTSEQEAAVDEKVDEVLTDLDVTNKNDYQKIRATYDYICEHTVYDYDNLEDDEYKLKYTAYAALIDGKAVCQGYALLFYRLALELGVDSRLISGTGNGGAHGWNITELNDVYYNLDTTWDAGESEYSYFLKCDANFKGHERDEEYATEEFYASYPMAEEDYVIPEICEPGQHQYEASFEWTEITDEKGNGTGQYSATATLTCTVCGDEVGNLEAEVAYDEENSIPATCEQTGQDSYIATVTYEEKTYTGEKEVEIPVADHTWEEEYTVDKEATCEEAGSESIHCSVCDERKEGSEREIPATGHEWDEGKVTKEASCAEEGEKTYTCTKCGETKTEPIEKLDHTWEEKYTIDKEATCGEAGSESIHCSVCGTTKAGSEKEIPATGHDWDEGKVTKEASCAEEGEKTYTCTKCGETKTEPIEKLDHTWEEKYTIDKEATCGEAGSESIHCSVCGTTKAGSEKEIPATGHEWDEGKVTKEATCAEEGEKTYTCTKCGETKTEPIEKLDHTWEEKYTIDKEATCGEAGSESIHCSVCGTTKAGSEKEIPATGHEWDEGKVTKEATCAEEGEKTYTCTKCGETKTEPIEKLDHTWEEKYTIDKEATCEEAGSESIHCSVCGAIQEESVQKIPATGHNFGEWVITKEPTEKEEGLQERACQNQGCSKKETETIPKLATVSVQYRTHVQTYSWEEEWRSDGDLSGTEGQAKRLEAIQIQLKDQKYTGDIVYKTHVQTYGWQSEVKNGTTSGTEGKAKRLEAIKIYLTGEMAEKYDVYYCVHAQTYGWLGWAKNGEYAGTAGLSKRLEGIKIVLVEKGGKEPQQEGNTDAAYVTANSASGEKSTNYVTYRTHVQTIGWQDWKYDGVMSGTEGQSKRLEGIEIQLADNLNTDEKYEGDIEYQTHIQGYGWEEDWKGTWAKNGALSGTESQSRRLEAICIRLTGEMEAHFDVYYRVHAQTFGWLGWAKNGAEAGTAGYGKRLEGIEIVLVEKNGKAPGDTANAFKEK